MKPISILSTTLVCSLLMCGTSFAYEPITHSEMSEAALKTSVIGSNQPALRRYGLKSSIFSDGSTFQNSRGESNQSISDLVRFGADWEDTRAAIQAIRHFYNPVDGSKLLPLAGETSPDWALEDRGVKDSQPYSYRLMRRNFLNALSAPAKGDRDIAWGMTFQTLGHVIHHLQDMAQPQHVRGDAHCDSTFPCLLPGAFVGFYSPSIYEKRVERVTPE